MANYRTIGDVFQTKGLVVPTLRALVPDGQLFDVMAIQPAGNLVYRSDFVGHANGEEAVVYFTKYFQLSQQAQPDIVLTPEYSCPWEALIASMKERPPNSGKVWVVGCESISPASLATLIEQNPTFCWIHEDLPQGRPGFLDIVAYVTVAQTTDVLTFCREELLQQNYFHAVLEATKSISAKIRMKTGLTSDAGTLAQEAFGIGKTGTPFLAFNSLATDTHKSEQTGLTNLFVGMFGTFRNVTAHGGKISWAISERDALDLLTLVSLLHRRLDSTEGTSRQQ